MRRVPRHLKSDESFVEKIAMGATGGRRVCDHLRSHGHHPLELERGALSYKIWQGIKLKRLRVPDILCVNCGTRVEARAKTTLEISMSHSTADPERGWDYGLVANDYIAFVLCDRHGDEPQDWSASDLVQYVRVADLKEAERAGRVSVTAPKGREEGFETRIQWPVAVANYAGTVTVITRDSVMYQREEDGRTIPLKLERRGVSIEPIVQVGDTVSRGRILAAPVPVRTMLACAHDRCADDYIGQMNSPDMHERYAAAKALSVMWSAAARRVLESAVGDPREEPIVRLEAAATLMKQGIEAGREHVAEVLATDYDAERLEATVVLAEVGTNEAGTLLARVLLDQDQHADVRAGAAWALGEIGTRSAIPHLVAAFSALGVGVKADAARALSTIAREHVEDVIGALSEAPRDARAGIAWALAHTDAVDIERLLNQTVDDETRRWAAYVVGNHQRDGFVPAALERLRDADPEVYFAATVLWQVACSWIDGLEEY
ncbi:MAG: HEAT repeat domain-containing protein [Armatimonadota bacterium]